MLNKKLFFANIYPSLPASKYISRSSLFDFETLQQNFACQRLDLFLLPHSWAAWVARPCDVSIGGKIQNKNARLNGMPLILRFFEKVRNEKRILSQPLL
jgi:hypothetical protein